MVHTAYGIIYYEKTRRPLTNGSATNPLKNTRKQIKILSGLHLFDLLSDLSLDLVGQFRIVDQNLLDAFSVPCPRRSLL
jgi:hypothetical protein